MTPVLLNMVFAMASFLVISKLCHFCAAGELKLSNQKGVSIIEMITVLGLIGISTGIATANLKTLSSDIQNASSEVQGFIKQARARAIASTMAYRVVTPDDGHLAVEFSRSCNDATTAFQREGSLQLELPAQIRINPIADLCFSPRGISSYNAWISLSTRDWTKYASLEVGLAGSVKTHRW